MHLLVLETKMCRNAREKKTLNKRSVQFVCAKDYILLLLPAVRLIVLHNQLQEDVILDTPTVAQLVRKYHEIYGVRSFITAFTTAIQ